MPKSPNKKTAKQNNLTTSLLGRPNDVKTKSACDLFYGPWCTGSQNSPVEIMNQKDKEKIKDATQRMCLCCKQYVMQRVHAGACAIKLKV